MKKPLLTVLGVGILLVVLVGWFYMRSRRPAVVPTPVAAPEEVLAPTPEPEPVPTVVEAPPLVEEVEVAPEPVPEAPAVEIPVEPEVVEIPEEVRAVEAEEPEGVEVPGDQALAVVNEKVIMLKDLVPVPAWEEGLPKVMDPKEFRARLAHAIEAEVTFQAAAAQGIALTEEQQRAVQSLRDRKMADIERYRQEGLMWTSITEEQIALAERYATAALLLQNLLAAAGKGLTPVTDAEVWQYYEANPEKFGALPEDPAAREAAWEEIRAQVAQSLMSERQAQLEQATRELIEQLKSDAQINIVFNGGGA